MTTAHIAKFSGGEIHITTGGGSHSETRVTYSDNSTATFDIVGELSSSSITNISDVKSVEIGNTVTSIGDYAFYGCSALTSITISDSVTSIGIQAFYECSSMDTITIPDSVTSIGDRAFYYCGTWSTSRELVAKIPEPETTMYGSTTFIFLNRTLAQIKAMDNYSNWWLAGYLVGTDGTSDTTVTGLIY